MSLLDDSDNLRNAIISKLTDILPDIEARVYKKLLQLLDEYESSGGYFKYSKTSVNKLAAIQSEIEGILKEAGYFKSANIYIADLEKITQNTIDLNASINKLDIQRKSLTGIEKVYVQNAVNVLNEGGLNVNFVEPVTTILNEAITFGYSIGKTRETLEDFVLGGNDKSGKLKSYLTVTARDTVSQLQGAQMQAIQQEHDMKYLRYVGPLLKDSRGQCVHWKEMGYIEIANLQAEIDNAFKMQKRKAKEGQHQWSGMIPDTTPQNFLIRRGGWGCLHSAMPVRKKA